MPGPPPQDGIIAIVTAAVVGKAADGEEAICLAAELRPDVMRIDINVPKVNGIAATAQIVEANPETVTSHHSDSLQSL